MATRPTRLRINPVHGKRFHRCPSTQKAGFPNYAAALDGAERMMARGMVNPGCHITPFKCDDCGEWHLCNRVIVPMPGVNCSVKRHAKGVA